MEIIKESLKYSLGTVDTYLFKELIEYEEFFDYIQKESDIKIIEIDSIHFENEELIDKFLNYVNSSITINIIIKNNKLTYLSKILKILNKITFNIECENIIQNNNFKYVIDNRIIDNFYVDTREPTIEYIIKNNCTKKLCINENMKIDDYIELLKNNTSITSLSINHNTSLDINLIASMLKHKKNIKNLQLCSDNLSDIKPLINVLINYPSIKKLDISFNYIDQNYLNYIKHNMSFKIISLNPLPGIKNEHIINFKPLGFNQNFYINYMKGLDYNILL